MITKSGTNEKGKVIHYYFNYSAINRSIKYPYKKGKELLNEKPATQAAALMLEPWGVKIIEEE